MIHRVLQYLWLISCVIFYHLPAAGKVSLLKAVGDSASTTDQIHDHGTGCDGLVD